MADSYPSFTTRPFTRANNIHRSENDSNTYTRFVGKLLFFTFFLLAIPLFPSQAPDFINQTILNKFWELLHLMFIGIAVSYGLFGRRNVVVNLDDSQSYVSSMLHVPSVFEDGFDHSMYCSGGQGKAGFFNVKNGSFEIPYHEENAVQAWSSKYFQGEPMVVLAQPNCGLEKYGDLNSVSFIDFKPLGLPVRSLKSSSPDEFDNESSDSSGPSVKESPDSYNKSGSGRFSENLVEGKSNESVGLGSRIAWRSRSGRMGERVHGSASQPSHSRPLSVDETQFESLKSRSLRSTVSFSSQASSQSHSPSNSLSPTSHSNSSESPKSFPPNSPPPVPKPMSSQAPVHASHSRQYSDGSLLLGSRGKRSFEDALNEFCESKIKYDSLSGSSKKWISGSLKFDAKPVATTPTSKASSRGKSARTFRSFRASVSVNTKGARDAAGEKLENHKKGKLTMGSDEPKAEGHDNLFIGFNRQNFGGDSYMPKPTSPDNQNIEKQECSEISGEEISEDFDEVISSDEETMSGTFSVAGSEVDRKAGEFIAKFREQIRLQRTASIDTSTPRGLDITGGDFFR